MMHRLILLILFTTIYCVFADSSGLDGEHFLQFANEQLAFSMKYKGLNTAKSQMNLEHDGDFIKISWIVHTRSIFNILFHIDNRYESLLNIQSGRLLETIKRIDQKNIQQNIHIRYDWRKLQARADNGLQWQIENNCIDLLTMLYQLRTMDFTKGKKVDFLLDIEGQMWQINGVIKIKEKIDGRFSHLSAQKIILSFRPFKEIKKRAWKTDLLTNRIARPGGKLILWLGPLPEHLPLLIQFGAEGSTVQMKLEKVTIFSQ